jgi:2-keto-4-pentenoate hydratase/2-oxohepta-3-ene-1,7-dioic acid hydratase in catechol pathway
LNTIIVNGKVVTPSKIVCVGRNYVDHINELGNDVPTDMVVFNKPNSAITSTLKSFEGEPLHYEGEICFVYEKGGFSAVGFGLDLTKRTLQSELKAKGLPWERAKAFDGSALFSEFSLLTDSILVDGLVIQLKINDTLRQHGGVKLMMYKPDDILARIQTFMTLEDGDIVMTGTPKGVGEIETGQKFEGQILFEDKIVVNALWVAE